MKIGIYSITASLALRIVYYDYENDTIPGGDYPSQAKPPGLQDRSQGRGAFHLTEVRVTSIPTVFSGTLSRTRQGLPRLGFLRQPRRQKDIRVRASQDYW